MAASAAKALAESDTAEHLIDANASSATEVADLEADCKRLRAAASGAAAAAAAAEESLASLASVEVEVGTLASELAELLRKKTELQEKQARLASQLDPMSASQHLPKTLSELK